MDRRLSTDIARFVRESPGRVVLERFGKCSLVPPTGIKSFPPGRMNARYAASVDRQLPPQLPPDPSESRTRFQAV